MFCPDIYCVKQNYHSLFNFSLSACRGRMELRSVWSFIRLFHGENKLHSDERMTDSLFALDHHARLVFIFLTNWNNNPRVDVLLKSNKLIRFWANQSTPVFHKVKNVSDDIAASTIYDT